jgi:hypothetical protein
MEKHKANQVFVIQDPPRGMKLRNETITDQLIRTPEGARSPKADLISSGSENKMKEIKMTPPSTSKYVKFRARKPKPQARGLTQIDLNKYSLKHQISFDKDLMKI